MFAGSGERWRASDTDEWVNTFTIVTGEPGPVSGDLHDRQPVILAPECWDNWLNGDRSIAQDVLTHAKEVLPTHHPVSKALGNPRNTGRELIRPVAL